MENKKDHISRIVFEQIFLRGHHNLTMDGLAAQLHMSKKTLYICFRSRTEMVNSSIDVFFHEVEEKLSIIILKGFQDRDSFEEVFREWFLYLGNTLARLKIPVLQKIRVQQPELWDRINNHREALIRDRFGVLLQQARDKGLLDPMISIDLIIQVITALVSNPGTEEIIKESGSPQSVLNFMSRLMINGILNRDKKGDQG